MGKAYAHRVDHRPLGDLYSTPKSLVWVASDIINAEFSGPILEPCYGLGAISKELVKMGYTVKENDISNGVDYLTGTFTESEVITNPPFYLWDFFLEKAKTHAKKIMFIGRLNYLGTNSRYKSGIWNNLKAMYCFNRYVDYRTPYREDGHFHVGAMATAWFLWDMNYVGLPVMGILDVQQFATRGNFK